MVGKHGICKKREPAYPQRSNRCVSPRQVTRAPADDWGAQSGQRVVRVRSRRQDDDVLSRRWGTDLQHLGLSIGSPTG